MYVDICQGPCIQMSGLVLGAHLDLAEPGSGGGEGTSVELMTIKQV